MLETEIIKQKNMYSLYIQDTPIKLIGSNVTGEQQMCYAFAVRYTFRSLKSRIEEFLDHDKKKCTVKKISKRYYNSAFRYMAGYSKGKGIPEAGEVIKNFSKAYKSHKRAV